MKPETHNRSPAWVVQEVKTIEGHRADENSTDETPAWAGSWGDATQ